MSEREKISAELSAYLDGELPAPAAERIEHRLREDAALAAELERLRRTRELVRHLPRRSAPAGFVSGVLDQVERLSLVREGQYASHRPMEWVRYVAAAAVLLVAVGVGIVVGTMLWSGTGPGPAPRAPEMASRDGGGGPDGQPVGAGVGRATGGARSDGPSGRVTKAGYLGLDGGIALTNNEVIYASPADFQGALDEVAEVLMSNGVQPTATWPQNGMTGRKQVQILVYVEPEQGQQVQMELDLVRARQRAPQVVQSGPRPAEAPVQLARAPGPSPALVDPEGVVPPVAPCKGVGPASRPPPGATEAELAGQRMPGLAGNSTVVIRPGGRMLNELSNLSQSTVNAQPLLITVAAWRLETGGGPAAADAAGRDAAQSESHPVTTSAPREADQVAQ